jgi:hypothetical protein
LLNQSGVRLHIRVLDFGIARIYRGDDASQASTLTKPGGVLGTPRYMSPEQLAGQLVDARSDLYSAAIVIHETLTGHMPYVGGKKLCQLCPDATQSLQDLVDQCLKPNPSERPPNAVEVYLRLQELGKASGVLLLPPGAMEKLVAARGSEVPTIVYKPAARKPSFRVNRRLLFGGIAIALLVGLALALKLAFLSTTPVAVGPESLLGLKIGDAELPAELKLGTPKIVDPWKQGPPPHIGGILRAKDLGLMPEARQQLIVYSAADEHVTVLLYDGKVCGVVVRQPHSASTGRGLSVMDKVDQLYRLYDESPTETEAIELTPDEAKFAQGHVEVRRYGQLGIAFMIQKDRVLAIALYPPKVNP